MLFLLPFLMRKHAYDFEFLMVYDIITSVADTLDYGWKGGVRLDRHNKCIPNLCYGKYSSLLYLQMAGWR